MRYTLDANNLTLRYGGVRHIIPLGSITEVYGPGATVNGKPITVRWRGLADIVPGYLAGSGRSPQLGPVFSVSTLRVPAQVFVATDEKAYGLSPTNPSGFIEQLDRERSHTSERRANADTERHTPYTTLQGISAWIVPLWTDRLARTLLLVGLFLCILLFGYMSVVYSGLPNSLPLHWNSQAQVDIIGDPQELLRLPVFGIVVWLVNVVIAAWASRRERAATLFLLGGALAAQIVFAAGALSIVLRAP